MGAVVGQKWDRAVAALAVLIAIIGTLGVIQVGVGLPRPARAEAMHLAMPPAVHIPPVPTSAFQAPTSSPAGPPARAPFPALQVPAQTPLASPNGTIPTFAHPGAAAPEGRVGTWYGEPLILPVTAAQPGWVQVRLPQRPNSSTAWVRAGDVTMSSTPYFIVVSLSATQLMVYLNGHPVYDFPVGLGLPATPTPTGHFFVAIRETHPDPFYGPVVLDTSAHSEAIQSWEGMGDAIVAVHGPITSSADARIGSGGTRISNGCIRLHNSDLAHLAVVPAGTPIEIIP